MSQSSTPQTIFRSKRKERDFVNLSNSMLRDKTLSFRARGILAMALSHAGDWQIHQTWLQEQGTEGREAIRASMQELEAAGYVRFEEIRKSGRITGSRWTFHEEPVPIEERTDRSIRVKPPSDGKPSDGKPCDGKPSDGKPSPKNNNQEEERSSEVQSSEAEEEGPELFSPEETITTKVSAESVLIAWNHLPPEFPRAKTMTATRLKSLRERCKDHWWVSSWQAALSRMSISMWCKGHNSRKWKADIDFFLQEDSVTKILEGKYDNRDGQEEPQPFVNGSRPITKQLLRLY